MATPSAHIGLDDTTLRLVSDNRILRFLPGGDFKSLIRGAAISSVEIRQPLFAQGDDGRSVMVVLSGYMKLSSVTQGGREAILDIVGPGAVFGELAVLNNWPRAASAVALSACRLLAIDGQQFIRVLLRTPEALLATVRLLSERLRTATAQMTDAVDMPAHTRVAKALIHLAALHSQIDTDGVHIKFQLSQRELGGLSGLTRESINKHLAAFRDAGWIRLSGQSIALLNLAAMRQDVAAHELL